MGNIEKLLAPFNLTFGGKQDLLTILQTIKSSEVATTEVIAYLEEFKQNRILVSRQAGKGQKAYEAMLLKCPECQIPMYPAPVNTGPGDQTGDDSQTVWTCPQCFHDEFSTKSMKEQLEEIRR